MLFIVVNYSLMLQGEYLFIAESVARLLIQVTQRKGRGPDRLSIELWCVYIYICNARMISSCMLAEVDNILRWDFPVCY